MSLLDQRPRGWLRTLLRLPVKLFEARLGWLFADRVLLLHHQGRRSGRAYRTALEVVAHQERPRVWYVVAAWGERTDWLQNLRSHPYTMLMVGRRVVSVVADVLDIEQAATVLADYQRDHPATARLLGRLLGVDLRHDPPERLAARMPVVALRAVADDGDAPRDAGLAPDGTAAGRVAEPAAVAPVPVTRAQTRATYDRIAPVYQLLEGLWERKAITLGLNAFDLRPGATVLEVGCGPGAALVRLARAAQPRGHAVGVDLSLRMCQVALRRIRRAHVTMAASVVEGDASRLPLSDNAFDACFMSFTLELFDTPEIPAVLAEIRRVLRVGASIGVVALTRAGPDRWARRLYEWGHERLPRLLDCRPIYAEASLARAGFDVVTRQRVSLWGLPVDVIVAANPSPAGAST